MRIEVPFLPPQSASPNSRPFWAKKYTDGQRYHDAAFYCCVDARNRGYLRGLRFPFIKAKLSLTFVFAQERRRDIDNLTSMAKPAIDAVVDSGLILDDDSTHLEIGKISAEVDKDRAPLTIIYLEEKSIS